eukprot:4747997-Pleurochrysis_carterae.AAC.1
MRHTERERTTDDESVRRIGSGKEGGAASEGSGFWTKCRRESVAEDARQPCGRLLLRCMGARRAVQQISSAIRDPSIGVPAQTSEKR